MEGLEQVLRMILAAGGSGSDKVIMYIMLPSTYMHFP